MARQGLQFWGVGLVALACVGCSTINDRALRVLASKATAYAVVQGQLLEGDLQLTPDRTGKLTLHASDAEAALQTCVGTSKFEASLSGTVDVQCNDGTSVALTFGLISETRGFAYGATGSGPASLTFGLPAREALAYLRVPAGRSLRVTAGDTLEMQ